MPKGIWMGSGGGRAVLAGLCASLVGIGLARFAYTPLIPALVAAHWFAPAGAAALGAANLAGYLGGAVLAPRVPERATVAALRLAMVLAAVSFLACAARLGFAWMLAWRLASGVAGGVLMVLTPAAVLHAVDPSRRGLAMGAIFAGIGLGIAASGTLVPWLLQGGPAAAWLGLGCLCLVLGAAAWGGWPSGAPPADGGMDECGDERSDEANPAGVGGLGRFCLVYGLIAVALVPHMLFLVDFVARGLGQGLAAGARVWILFGLGALAGPIAAGRLVDRTGAAASLRLALPALALAIALPAVAGGDAGIAASAVVVGALVPGIVPMALGRVHELIPASAPGRRRSAWSAATVAFALGQAAAGYGASGLFAWGESYDTLFLLGAAAAVAALAVELVALRATVSGERSWSTEP